MIFRHPLLLLGLAVIALLGGMYLLSLRRRREFTMRFTNLALLQTVMGPRPGRRRHIPPLLFLLGAAGLVLAVADPVLNLEVARHDASVMLVIDVSGSMDATDVQPSRIEAAKGAARTMLKQLPSGYRVGLVSFNGSATLAAPLSDNRETVLTALDNLRAGGATAIGDALLLALQQLGPAGTTTPSARTPAMIVLLTDGVSNRGSDPLEAASQARTAGVAVNTVGVGSRGAAIAVHGQEIGGVDERALSTIASATSGKYYFADAAAQLGQIYSSLASHFGWRPLQLDVTVPAVILGTMLVVSSAALSLWWFRVLP